MTLPVRPPVVPMLARLARRLPTGPGLRYEPKWDGFRCLAFRDGDDVDLRSRNDRPFSRYFPEVVDAVVALDEQRVVLDGEALAVAMPVTWDEVDEAVAAGELARLVFLPGDALARVDDLGDLFAPVLDGGQVLRR